MTITPRECRQLARILGKYQSFLEDSIQNATGPNGVITGDVDKSAVAKDRKNWAEAEAWVKRLTE